MKIIGLTGGIGSGKTTVAQMFQSLGIPVYIADNEAKLLMNRSKVIRRKLIELVGSSVYNDKGLNRPFLSDKIFNDRTILQKVNDIVHPKVASHFKRWMKKQNSPYVIKEAAILFENGGYKECDLVITVISEEKERIKRVMKRDDVSKEKVISIIKNQWNDRKKIELSDFIISNNDIEDTKAQVLTIHREILKSIN